MSKWRWATFRRRRKESSAALERYLSNGFVRKSLCYGIDHRKATVAARYTEEVRRLLQFGVLFLSLAALLAPMIELFHH